MTKITPTHCWDCIALGIEMGVRGTEAGMNLTAILDAARKAWDTEKLRQHGATKP